MSEKTPRPRAKRPLNFTSRTEIVTPEVATKWLELNTNNRVLNKPLEDRQVDRYARDMVAGCWHLTGESIKFDTEGNLLDGQHRLWACILADTPFETLVTYGVEPEARIVIDTGKKRTLGHYLQMQEEPNAIQLAAAVAQAWRWDIGNIASDGSAHVKTLLNHEDAMRWLEDNPDIRQSVFFSGPVHREFRFARTQVAVSHYLNARIDGEQADNFWTAARTGAYLPTDSPVLALRRWIQNQVARSAGRTQIRGDLTLVVFLKAMNLWHSDKAARILSVKDGEKITTWDGLGPGANRKQ